MKTLWQFIKLSNNDKKIIKEHLDTPPKDVQFIVYSLAWRDTQLGRDTIKAAYVEWVGIAEWSKADERYFIQKNDGFVSLPKLEKNMVWGVFPLKGKWR